MNDTTLIINQLVNATDGSTVSNVVQQVFVGEYERLRDAYIHPWPVFERVDVGHFVGREWLLAEVDNFLDSHDRGYFILEAEAGLGKTAFLAWLVKERAYIHHFAELAPGLQGIGPGLKSLAAQLVVACELEAYQAEGVLPGAAARSDFLLSLLNQSAAKLQRGEKIILVVDALDEAGTPYNQNVLGLPSILPEGVYFIVSQRPVALTLQVEVPHTARRLLRLTSNSDENLHDMRRFLERMTTWHSVAQAIQNSNFNASQFVTTLLDKCQGIWIYLHYVVREIEGEDNLPLDLNALPSGMTQYYSRYWQNWRNQDEEQWYRVYLPLLATLAAAQEAIPANRLVEWAGIKMPTTKLRRLLKERWRPFISNLEQGEQTHFRFYHASLRDFFEGRVESDSLIEQEKSFVFELSKATQKAHHRLVERYLKEWGGLEKRLPGLQDPRKQGIDGGYGLRNLTVHLERANRVDDIHQLLQMEWEKTEDNYSIQRLYRFLSQLRGKKHLNNIWYMIKDAVGETDSYLGDIERAWQLTRKQTEGANSPRSLGLQFRYALIVSSVNTFAQNLPPNLIKMLVENRVWAPEKAVVYSRQVHRLANRMKLWLAIADYLPEPVKNATLSEVSAAIKYSKLGLEDLNILSQIASKMPDLLVIDLWQFIKTIEDKELRITAAIRVASYLPQDEKRKAATEAYTWVIESFEKNPFTDPEWQNPLLTNLEVKKFHLLIKLIRYLPPGSSSQTLQGLQSIIFSPIKGQVDYSFALAFGVHNQGFGTFVLVDLATALDVEAARKKVLELAYQVAGFETDWLDAQAYVIAHLPREQQMQKRPDLLKIIRNIDSVNDKAKAYAKLCTLWSAELMDEVIDAVKQATDPQVQMEAIVNVVPHLTEPLIRQVLRIANALPDRWKQESLRAEALAVCVPYLPRNERINLLNKALSATRAIQDDNQHVETLISIVSRLSSTRKDQVLAKARSLKDIGQRIKNLLNLLPHEFEEQEQILKIALSSIKLVQEELPDLLKNIPQFPLACQSSVLEVVLTIRDKKVRAKSLAALAPKLSKSLLPQVITIAEQLSDVETSQVDLNARAVAELLCYLPDAKQQDLLQEMISMLVSIPDENLRSDTLEEVVTMVPDSKKEQVIALIIDSVGNARLKLDIFLKLIPFLSKTQQDQLMSKIWTCTDENIRLAMSTTLLASPFSKVKEEVIIKMLQHLSEDQLSKWICTLLPYLPARLKAKMFVTAKQMQDISLQAKVLSQFVTFPLDSLTIELLRDIQSIQNHAGRAFLLTALIVRVATPLFQEALRIVQGIEDPKARIKVLVKFIPYLSWSEKCALLQMVQQHNDEKFQTEVLLTIARYLPDEGLSTALEMAQNIMIDGLRAELLIGLARYLPRPLYERLLVHAYRLATRSNAEQVSFDVLDNIKSIQGEAERVKAIIRIAPRLPAHDTRALKIVEQLSNEEHQTEALAALVPFLNDSLKQQVLEHVKNVVEKDVQVKVIVRIIPFLPTHPVQPNKYSETSINPISLRDEALIMLWRLDSINAQEEVLAGYLAHFLERIKGAARVSHLFDSDKRSAEQYITEIFTPILGKFLEMIDGMADEVKKLSTILYLIPHFTEEQRQRVLSTALLLIEKLECRTEQTVALIRLAPYLTNSLLGRAQVIVRKIYSDIGELGTETCSAEGETAKGERAEKYRGKEYELPQIVTELPKLSLQDIGLNLLAINKTWQNSVHAETLLMRTLQILESSSIQLLEALRKIKDEEEKANIIKQVAPYFPEILQDQVLALACTIHKEAIWAEVLAHLSDDLPKAGLWEALLWKSLAYRHELETRTRLISSLPSLQDNIQLDTRMKLRLYAQNAKNQVAEESAVIIEALLALLPSLPDRAFWTIFKNVWLSAYHLCSMRPEILTRLVPELAKRGFVYHALLVVKDIAIPHLQAEAIRLVSPFLRSETEFEEAISLASTIQMTHWRSMAFSDLAVALANSGDTQRALSIACKIQIEYPLFKAKALLKLLSCLTDEDRESILRMCLTLAPKIRDESNRARILGELARHLKGVEQEDVLYEAINVASVIEEADIRAKTFESLAQVLIEIRPLNLHALGGDLLWRLAKRTRPDLLSDIRALSSVIVAVGGTEAAETIFDEVKKVSQWWP